MSQEHAAGALRSLSVNAENQNLIVQNLGLPPLVALLHSQNAAVQEQAVVCIRNLSVNDENEIKIVQEPYTLTLNPEPNTLNPKPHTLNPTPSTLNPQPSTLNPQTLQEGALPPLIKLLQSPVERIQVSPLNLSSL